MLHPRNRHSGRYDFPKLIAACPELGEYVILNPYGKQSIDFANPDAVRVFNRALLRQFYGIQHWDIPAGYLCPPVPGRADYLHGLADLLAADNGGVIPRGAAVRVLDIGTGANCIYPLIGHREYGWYFTGSDIDATALASARTIVAANGLDKGIELRRQDTPKQVFKGILAAEDRFELTLCNPPFHASQAEAASGSQRKWRNLGKLDPSRKLPKLNFGGQAAELWCEGGEAAFVARMADEPGLHQAGLLVQHAGIEGRQRGTADGAPATPRCAAGSGFGYGPGAEEKPLRRLDLSRCSRTGCLARRALAADLNRGGARLPMHQTARSQT